MTLVCSKVVANSNPNCKSNTVGIYFHDCLKTYALIKELNPTPTDNHSSVLILHLKKYSAILQSK